MKLRLDPWATDYDTAFHAEDPLDASGPSATTVTPDIECETWRPLRPAAEAEPRYERLFFMDGSRRSEARLLLEDERRQVAFGAIGTFGVGVVDCCPGQTRRADYLDLDAEMGVRGVQRLCTLGNDVQLPDFDILPRMRRTFGTLSYRVLSTDKTDADAVLRQLQFAMLEAERRLALRLNDLYPEALVVTDGPRPRMGDAPRVVGYLKTIHALPLAEEYLSVARSLEEGQRSPLYLVSHRDKSQQVFQWFLRLRDPNPWLYSFAGMVRLEAHAGSQPETRLAEVQALADWLTCLLPRFATRAHQDPRAPQQLLPVRALEAELKRRMGHAQVVRRRILEHLQEQA